MPIILTADPERERRLSIGESVVVYTKATGDEVQAALESRMDRETGQYDYIGAESALMRSHIVGWEGVIDSLGNEVPFAQETVDIFVRGLGYADRQRIATAITATYIEAVEGKGDSSSGLSGTD